MCSRLSQRIRLVRCADDTDGISPSTSCGDLVKSRPQHLECQRRVKKWSPERSHRARWISAFGDRRIGDRVTFRRQRMRQKLRRSCGDSCLHFESREEPTQTPSRELIKACQDPQGTHDANTPHRSETSGVAERVVPQAKKETAPAMVQSCFPEERWICAMECCCYVRKVHDKIANGTTTYGEM